MANRVIKFRVYDIIGKQMYYDGNLINGEEFVMNIEGGLRFEWSITFKQSDFEIMQYTGLKDRNGKEIYDGDILRVRRPGRDQQTHYGDNIPLGHYTEPLEPIVHEFETEVKFQDGVFGCDVEDTEHVPLNWVIKDCHADNEDHLKEMFSDGWGPRIFNGWEDDKEYLLEDLGLASVDELINYIGITVIGNIYEHPNLLKEANQNETT